MVVLFRLTWLFVVLFRVAGIYAPNRNPDRDDFSVRCVNDIDPIVPPLLWGDFNTFWLCCQSPQPLSFWSLMKVLLCCLVDIWCDLHPGVSAFTWCWPNGALASHIDLIGCPYVWVPYVTSADILPYLFSNPFLLLGSSRICGHGPRVVEIEPGYFGGGWVCHPHHGFLVLLAGLSVGFFDSYAVVGCWEIPY